MNKKTAESRWKNKQWQQENDSEKESYHQRHVQASTTNKGCPQLV